MKQAGKNPTLDDVAIKAGVSSATVSRYINNPKVVSKKTGVLIDKAISATGYIPNLIAGGLASNKSRMVAVLIPHLTESIFNDTIEAMTEELTAAGLNVMLGLTGPGVGRSEEMVRAALGRRVDAIISTAPHSEALDSLLKCSATLYIQIWELVQDPIGCAIGFSHDAAGRDIARFLRSRGYSSPHLITADGTRAKMRSKAFNDEWRKLGGGEITESIVDIPSRFGHARRVFSDLRRLPSMPDVVVAGSDYLAQGVIVEAQARGLRVPDDLAVMGFGNSSIAGDMRPTITTVDVDGTRIAREAIAAIRAHSTDEPVKSKCVDVGFRLTARESA